MTPGRIELPQIVDMASRTPVPDGLATVRELDMLALALRTARQAALDEFDARIAAVDVERHAREDAGLGVAFEAYVAARRAVRA